MEDVDDAVDGRASKAALAEEEDADDEDELEDKEEEEGTGEPAVGEGAEPQPHDEAAGATADDNNDGALGKLDPIDCLCCCCSFCCFCCCFCCFNDAESVVIIASLEMPNVAKTFLTVVNSSSLLILSDSFSAIVASYLCDMFIATHHFLLGFEPSIFIFI